ncbi:MAG: FmdB family transcriptional regulator [Actinobacteria bacterium]|nr:FmdB family transcriptional regulator [Actinomycetota bacterium]
MPTYHYRCASCEQHLEVVQSMTDDPITECAACGGQMQKVLLPVGIVLKGSGFYRTDNRSGSKTATKASEKSQKTETKGTAESTSSKKDSSGASGSGTTKAADAKSA